MSEAMQSAAPTQPDYFQQRRDDAAMFEDQNSRYDQLNVDPTFDDADVVEFRQIGKDALYQEQLDTRELLLAEDLSPYEEVAEQYAAKQAELAAAEAKLATISDIEDARKARLLAAARRVTELAPYAKGPASSLAQEKIAAIEQLDRAGLKERIGSLGVQLADMEAAHYSGEAWPAPRIIWDYESANQPEAETPETPEETVIVEDEIPVDPETHELGEPTETQRKLIERHGLTHKASLKLAAFFMDHTNIIFMPQQLGAFLYTDESHFAGMSTAERDRCISTRIHCLLNQHELVKPMLEEEGFQLQYGYRHYINSLTGKSVQRKRRIYRVVRTSEFPDAPDTFEETIDPALQPEALMPPVYHHSSEKAAPRELMPVAAAEDKPELEETFTAHVQEVIEQLNDLGLLPEQVDDSMTVLALKTKLLQKVSRRNRQHPAVKALKARAEGSYPHNKTNATEMVIAALDPHHQPKYGSTRDVRRVETIVSSMLETYYDSLTA